MINRNNIIKLFFINDGYYSFLIDIELRLLLIIFLKKKYLKEEL